jgi:hypothetical protein
MAGNSKERTRAMSFVTPWKLLRCKMQLNFFDRLVISAPRDPNRRERITPQREQARLIAKSHPVSPSLAQLVARLHYGEPK